MKKIAFVSVLLAIGGCAGPYVLIENIDPKIIETITVYEDKSILENDGITILGAVTATSCKHLLWDPEATRENCSDQLKMKASGLGANAIVTGASEKNNANFLPSKGINRNCWNTVDCSAVAIIKK